MHSAVRVSRKDHHIRKFTNGKIVGGTLATLGQFPYQASMQYDFFGWTHYCGGSILDETHVQTAGHCGASVGDRVVAGIIDLPDTGSEAQVRSITRVVTHPDYSGVRNDITVVTVRVQLLRRKRHPRSQRPAAIHCTRYDGNGACTASGWGSTSWTGGTSDDLLYVEIDFIDDDTCMEMWAPDPSSPIPEQNICAGVEEGFHTVCYGDSGGPMVCDADDGGRYLFGSTSWGPQECGIGLAGRQTRLQGMKLLK
ncbi:unnamed protein product [Darwinula stevensoni]|uniref:Peptidase S1 domain-containing protein n=1 Tax=Darwinula stevensoni TaxID=69355 RepID=A0A7R8XJJ8_9CRUS|nr:unnamed protein product [Darwinula stevensoni]CAG0894890.1 unnamed protein product [Darwinula stevensoni]